jgi:SynChlorMet cassette radical SAM/SPASM protein ScmE
VQVSIDGAGAEFHDACRGDGNFLKAIAGINNLRKHNVPVAVRVTIHKHNVRNLEEIARLLLDEIGLPGFSTNAASYFGLCAKNAEQVQLTVEERSIAIETLLRLNEKYIGRINSMAGPLAEGKSWNRMERARISGEDYLPGRGRLTGCGCPMTQIAIRADGAIVPCNMLSHIKLGQVNRDSLQDVWLNHPEMKKLRARRSIPLSDFEFCNGCEYINYCTGNCPALAYTLLGKVDHPSPNACLRKFLDDGGKLPVSF